MFFFYANLVVTLSRVDGGYFFIGGNIMEIEQWTNCQYMVTFDSEELMFLMDEASGSDLTLKGMIEELFGMIFVGGYKVLTGKD